VAFLRDGGTYAPFTTSFFGSSFTSSTGATKEKSEVKLHNNNNNNNNNQRSQ
jgi:hypothetical protein